MNMIKLICRIEHTRINIGLFELVFIWIEFIAGRTFQIIFIENLKNIKIQFRSPLTWKDIGNSKKSFKIDACRLEE